MPRRTLLAGLAALVTSACARVEFFVANAPTVFGAYHRKTNLRYGDRARQRLDVYVPDASVSVRGERPLIVFWHGGRWEFGDKSDYRFVGAALAELGCVAVLPDYRLYPEVRLDGFMEDAARAVLWAAAHAAEYGADPSRLYLMGHSSGAHMAALLALNPKYFTELRSDAPPLAGVIGLSGPYDFLPLKEEDLQDMFGPPSQYELSQPIHFVHSGAPPMLLVQGGRDRTVGAFNSKNLAAALRTAGDAVTLKLYPELAHADTVAALSEVARGRAPVVEDIKTFLAQTG
jgi:acetyl esterase/lipase